MKLTAKELESLVCNNTMNDYMRDCVGSALCDALYDSANSDEDYPNQYHVLYEATFYNSPSDDDIALCLDYIHDVLGYDLDDFNLELKL